MQQALRGWAWCLAVVACARQHEGPSSAAAARALADSIGAEKR